MKRGTGKRGITPVIGTVYLVILVLLLALLVFMWARGFLLARDEKFGVMTHDFCGSVHFKAATVPIDGGIYVLEVVNAGNVAIKALGVKKILKGNSDIEYFDFSMDPGKAIREPVIFYMGDGITPPEKIEVFPLVEENRGNKNRLIPCYEYRVSFNY